MVVLFRYYGELYWPFEQGLQMHIMLLFLLLIFSNVALADCAGFNRLPPMYCVHLKILGTQRIQTTEPIARTEQEYAYARASILSVTEPKSVPPEDISPRPMPKVGKVFKFGISKHFYDSNKPDGSISVLIEKSCRDMDVSLNPNLKIFSEIDFYIHDEMNPSFTARDYSNGKSWQVNIHCK